MRFEKSIDIDAPQERVWEVLSAIEAWPERIETVDSVELLTPAPITTGSRVRLKQPKLPEGTWDVTVWDPPSYFEWTQKMTGATSVAGHRVEPLGFLPIGLASEAMVYVFHTSDPVAASTATRLPRNVQHS